jgi:hypothetical protein
MLHKLCSMAGLSKPRLDSVDPGLNRFSHCGNLLKQRQVAGVRCDLQIDIPWLQPGHRPAERARCRLIGVAAK